jgi:hypothetical protein
MMTGEEYKASLFDGRATFFEGKRVDDIPAHRFLGPPAQRVADDYDWLLTQAVDGHSPINDVPKSPDELRAKVDLVHRAGMMAHVTYTSIMTLATTQGKLSDIAPQYVERIDGYIRDAQARDIRITQCIGDGVPDCLGSGSDRGERRGHLAMLPDLGLARRAVAEVTLDQLALICIDGIEGVGAEKLFDFGMALLVAHVPTSPAWVKGRRRWRSPERMRVLTVPSGSPSRHATSR